EVRGYCRKVRAALDDAEHDAELMNTAIEHRLMHAETLAYMLHQLPLDRKLIGSAGDLVAGARAAPPAGAIEIPAGIATLGQPRNGAFGWDNEFVAHEVEVPAFAINRYKVSNADFLQFIEAGGYQVRALWTGAAWQWKAE